MNAQMSPHRVCSTKKFFPLLIFVGHRGRGKPIPLFSWFPDMPTITCTHTKPLSICTAQVIGTMKCQTPNQQLFQNLKVELNLSIESVLETNKKRHQFNHAHADADAICSETNKWFLRKYYYLAGRFGTGRLFRIRQSVTTTNSFLSQWVDRIIRSR